MSTAGGAGWVGGIVAGTLAVVSEGDGEGPCWAPGVDANVQANIARVINTKFISPNRLFIVRLLQKGTGFFMIIVFFVRGIEPAPMRSYFTFNREYPCGMDG
jgi:hypothetical protein